MKTYFDIESLLRNNQQKVVTNGSPYLCVNCVLAGYVQGLDVELLLYPFEKELYLSSFTIKFCDGKSFQREVVGQGTINNCCRRVFIYNESKAVGIPSDTQVAGKADSLITDKACIGINFAAINDFIRHIVLCPCYKESIVLLKMVIQALQVNISFIHKVIRADFCRYSLHHPGIVDISFDQFDERKDRTSQIHQYVHLHSSSSVMELGPRAEFKVKLDCAAVKSVNHFIQSKSKNVLYVQRFSLTDKPLGIIPMYSPISFLVSFCQSGLRHNGKPAMIQIPCTKFESGLNVPEPGPVCALSEVHHAELVSGSEFDRMSIAFVARGTLRKLIFAVKRYNLRENCFALVHRRFHYCKTQIFEFFP